MASTTYPVFTDIYIAFPLGPIGCFSNWRLPRFDSGHPRGCAPNYYGVKALGEAKHSPTLQLHIYSVVSGRRASQIFPSSLPSACQMDTTCLKRANHTPGRLSVERPSLS